MKFDAFGTLKHGEGESLSKNFFATLISTLGRFNRANKKICHIHFKFSEICEKEDEREKKASED